MKKFLENLYNYSWGGRASTVVNSITETNDGDYIKYTVNLTINKYKREEINGEYLTIYDENNEPVVESSTEQAVEYLVPSDNNALVTVDSKSRVQITSAKWEPSIRFMGTSSFNVDGWYVSTYNNNATYNWGNPIDLNSILKYFDLLDAYAPTVEHEKVATLSQSEVDEITSIKFSERTIAKLKLYSEGKWVLDDHVTHASLNLLMDLLVTGEGAKCSDLRTPIDYKYVNTLDGLVNELQGNWSDIRADIRYNVNKLNYVYNTKIQNIIDRYFRLQAKEFRNVQSPKDSNAVTMMSQAHKLYFYTRDKYYDTWEKERVYNKYFIGVLDPIRTTDSSEINKNNELSAASKIEGGEIKIKVLDKDFNEKWISYIEYSESGVLTHDHANYDTKEIVPNAKGEYVYLKYGKWMTTKDPNDFKYIRVIDNLLSPATKLVPFLNRMEPTRALLGSHFLDQSIPVVGAKPPIVSTGAGRTYYKESPYNTKSDVDGEVVDIYEGNIKIKYIDPDTNEEKFKVIGPTENYTETAQHTTNEFNPTVKVGDTVHKGQIVSAMNSFVDGEFTTQVPLYTMFGDYRFGTHEDGIMLTESAAKKFSHECIITLRYSLSAKFEYMFKKPDISTTTNQDDYDDYGIIKVGSKIKRGDVLFSYDKKLDVNSPLVKLKSALMNDSNVVTEIIERAPMDIQFGTVEKVEFYSQWDWNENYSGIIPYYRDKMDHARHDYYEFYGKYPDEHQFDSGSTQFEIYITIKYLNTMSADRLSGKLTNFYASKGVNTVIIPDEEAPKDEFGNTIECIINLRTLGARQNPGQIDDNKLGLIGIEMWKYINDKKGRTFDDDVMDLLKQLYPKGYPIGDDKYAPIDSPEGKDALLKDGDSYGYIRFQVKPFDKYYGSKTLLPVLNKLGLGDGTSRIYYPKEGTWTVNKSAVGMTSMMRLHFLQDKKGKASGELGIEKDTDNIYYMDTDKEEGQKIGAQESWAMMAHGKQGLLSKLATNYDDKEGRLTSTLLMLGLDLDTNIRRVKE